MLHLYWQRRVELTPDRLDRRRAVRELCEKIVQRRRARIADPSDVVDPAVFGAVDALLRDGVLREDAQGRRPGVSGTAGTGNGQDTDDGPDMDARSAAGIMRQAQVRARSELTVNRPLLLGSAGLVYLLAYGTIWLAVRGQRPYQGPPGWSLGVLVMLVLIAVIVTAAVVNRAVTGIGGQSRRRRRIAFLAFAAGMVAV